MGEYFDHLKNDWGTIVWPELKLPSARYGEHAVKLLKGAVKAYVNYCIDHRQKFEDDYCEFPFNWGERQNQALMFHALIQTNHSAVVSPEVRYSRQKKKRRNWIKNNYVDFYYAQDISDNNSDEKFELLTLIEYKQVGTRYIFNGTDKLEKPTGMNNKWSGDITKLQRLTREIIEENWNKWSGHHQSPLIKVVLLAVPLRQESTTEKLENLKYERFKSSFNDLLEMLDPSPNWGAYWYFPEEKQQKGYYKKDNDEGYTFFRGVYFFARIFNHDPVSRK